MKKILSLIKQIIFEGNIFISQKTIRILCQIIVPLILFIIAFFTYYTNDTSGLYEFSAELGHIGLYLFIFVLYISPLRIILPEFKILAKLLVYRRQFGIATFYVLAFHGIGLIISLNIFSQLPTILKNFTNTLTWGIIALIILFFPYITSNNISIKLLKKNWKQIQKLVYLAFVATIIHTFLIEEYLSAILFIVYIILKILAAKKMQIRLFDIFRK